MRLSLWLAVYSQSAAGSPAALCFNVHFGLFVLVRIFPARDNVPSAFVTQSCHGYVSRNTYKADSTPNCPAIETLPQFGVFRVGVKQKQDKIEMTCRERAYSCVQVKPSVSGRTGTQSVCNVCGTDLRKKLYSVRSLYTFILIE